MKDYRNPKDWKLTHKKRYNVYMCRPAFGTHIHNKLKHSDYETNEKKQFVLSGTVGEQWVIDANKLASTYTFDDDTPITPETLRTKIAKDTNGQIDWCKLVTKTDTTGNFAFHLPITEIRDFPVKTSWGETLIANKSGEPHGKGDFLVCAITPDGRPNLNDVWVVNGNVFQTTYDMRPFPGIKTDEQIEKETKKPEESLITTKKTAIEIFKQNKKFKHQDIIDKVRKIYDSHKSDAILQELKLDFDDSDIWERVEGHEELLRIDFRCHNEAYKIIPFIEFSFNQYNICTLVQDLDGNFEEERLIEYGYRQMPEDKSIEKAIRGLKIDVKHCVEKLNKEFVSNKSTEDIVNYIASKLTLRGFRIEKDNDSESYGQLWSIEYPASVDTTAVLIYFEDYNIKEIIKEISITVIIDADETLNKTIQASELDVIIPEINKELAVYSQILDQYKNQNQNSQSSQISQKIQQSNGTASGVFNMFKR